MLEQTQYTCRTSYFGSRGFGIRDARLLNMRPPRFPVELRKDGSSQWLLLEMATSEVERSAARTICGWCLHVRPTLLTPRPSRPRV